MISNTRVHSNNLTTSTRTLGMLPLEQTPLQAGSDEPLANTQHTQAEKQQQQAERRSNLLQAFGLETFEKALTFAPKLVSLRQVTQTKRAINWGNTAWLTQMASFSILGAGVISTASADIFQWATKAPIIRKNRANQEIRTNLDSQSDQKSGYKYLKASLIAIPIMASFTVPFSYYEQKLQTSDAVRLANMFAAGDFHQILRRMPSWMVQKGLSRAAFMSLNELTVAHFKLRNEKAKKILLGIALSVIVHGAFWPMHWLTVQLSTEKYRDTSAGSILSDLYKSNNGALSAIIGTVYAGFLMHCLSYVISGATESLTLSLLRPAEQPQATHGPEDLPLYNPEGMTSALGAHLQYGSDGDPKIETASKIDDGESQTHAGKKVDSQTLNRTDSEIMSLIV